MRAAKLLRDHKVDYNILTTVHAANAEHPLEVYRFLRDEVKADFIQFIPIVERDNDTGFQEGDTVTDRSVKADHYGRFLISIFNEWLQKDVGRVFVQIFDVALAAWVGVPLGSAPSQRPAGRPWPWSTMGICTPAIILWSRNNFRELNEKSMARMASSKSSRSSDRISSTACRITAAAVTSDSSATANVPRTAFLRLQMESRD